MGDYIHEKMKMSITMLTEPEEGLRGKNWGEKNSIPNNRDTVQ